MTNKRHIFTNILEWLLIIISVVSVWMGGYIAGLKFHEINYHTPNVVLTEKKSIANEQVIITPKQSAIYNVFTTSATSTFPFQNIFAVCYTTYANLSVDATTFYGLNGYFDICLSNTQRYDSSTIGSYSFTFNDNSIQSFDFQIDYELPIINLDSISILVYVGSLERDELETTMEIYINDNYYTEYNFFYDLPRVFNVYQFYDLNIITELVNQNILENNYFYGYDEGYYEGKLDGYDEGYYDREEEYIATDSAFEKVWNIISNAFASVFNVFDIELFAGIKLFHILAIPLIISVLYFVIKILAK